MCASETAIVKDSVVRLVMSLCLYNRQRCCQFIVDVDCIEMLISFKLKFIIKNVFYLQICVN